MSDITDHVRNIMQELKVLEQHDIPEGAMPDMIGLVNEIRAKAQDLVGMLKVESDVGKGHMYELKRDGAYTRSYNMNGLIKRRMDAEPGVSPADVLAEMWDEGVLSPLLRWTQLNQWATSHNVTITVAQHEIADGDEEAEVGEYWKPKPLKVQPLEAEKGGPLG